MELKNMLLKNYDCSLFSAIPLHGRNYSWK